MVVRRKEADDDNCYLEQQADLPFGYLNFSQFAKVIHSIFNSASFYQNSTHVCVDMTPFD